MIGFECGMHHWTYWITGPIFKHRLFFSHNLQPLSGVLYHKHAYTHAHTYCSVLSTWQGLISNQWQVFLYNLELIALANGIITSSFALCN